jgi:hypothetical protein
MAGTRYQLRAPSSAANALLDNGCERVSESGGDRLVPVEQIHIEME